MQRDESVRSLGEFGLIARLLSGVDATGAVTGPGDDAAVLPASPGLFQLATTDTLVEDVHFSRKHLSPYEVGRKAVEVSLSDIAAMGGRARWLLISLTLKPDTPIHYLDEVYRGMIAASNRSGTAIVGGNIARSDGPLIIDVVALGDVPAADVLTRSGARGGDALAVTGTLGNATAARMVRERSVTDRRLKSFADIFVLPNARLQVGQALAAAHIPTAMMDISDGLSSDVRRLGAASGLGAVIVAGSLPMSPELLEAARVLRLDPLELALSGGEDYELLLALPEPRVDEARQCCANLQLTVIGSLLSDAKEFILQNADGTDAPLPSEGWTHF